MVLDLRAFVHFSEGEVEVENESEAEDEGRTKAEGEEALKVGGWGGNVKLLKK